MAASYVDLCGICFTDVHPTDNPRGTLNSCDHVFCSYCITEWAKNTNVCPLCKARFTRVTTARPGSDTPHVVKVRRRNYHAWEEAYSDDGSEAEGTDPLVRILCRVCQQGENAARIIFCDRRQCDYMAHLECLGMYERPLTFLCEECIRLRQPGGKQTVTFVTSVTHNSSDMTPSELSQGQLSRVSNHDDRASCERNNIPSAPAAHSPSGLRSRKMAMRPPAMRPISDGSTSSSARSAVAPPRAPDTPSNPCRGNDLLSPQASPTGLPRKDADDDLYFLTPARHSIDAMRQLSQLKESRMHAASLRKERQLARESRIRCALGHQGQPHSMHLPGKHSRPFTHEDVVRPSQRRRLAEPTMQDYEAQLACAETDLSDLNSRHRLVERMARAWAVQQLPVLRRNQVIAESRLHLDRNGSVSMQPAPSPAAVSARMDELWERALNDGRRIAQEKLDAQLYNIRLQKEKMVTIKAQREAAALAKLARIVASHRQQSTTNGRGGSEGQT